MAARNGMERSQDRGGWKALRRPLSAALMALSLSLPVLAPSAGAWAQGGADATMRVAPTVIASASIGSTDYRVAGAACEVAREAGGRLCAVAPLPSGAAALRSVADGLADFALLRADTYLAERAVLAQAGQAVERLAPVMALHDDVITLIGTNGLESSEAAALIGRRINVGAPETVTRALWTALEAALGAEPTAFPLRTELRAQEAGRALCEGRIEGFLWLLSHPSGATRTLLADCDAQVLNLRGPGIDALLAKRPDLRRVVIPSALYGTALEAETIGTPALLVAGPHVDDADVAALARALIGNVETLAQRHPSLARIDARSLISRGIPVPLHPAAAEAYRALGFTY
ncbi:MAG: TAXI family TRAP transporter solute-binding subunit [Pseudomonadota bacterium]